jgi:hypothetical protein
MKVTTESIVAVSGSSRSTTSMAKGRLAAVLAAPLLATPETASTP